MPNVSHCLHAVSACKINNLRGTCMPCCLPMHRGGCLLDMCPQPGKRHPGCRWRSVWCAAGCRKGMRRTCERACGAVVVKQACFICTHQGSM